MGKSEVIWFFRELSLKTMWSCGFSGSYSKNTWRYAVIPGKC